MPDSDINQLNAANANFGTQNFYGAVYIVAPAAADAPAAAPPIHVFFSYARADDSDDYDDPDKSLLRRLTDDLTAAGFAVWWDRVSLPSRSLSFSAEIEAAIANCERFLLVAGPGAKDSEWVQAELKCARDHCRPITVMLRGGDFSHIPDGFDKINAIDFRPPRAYAAALGDLANRLRQPAPVAPLLNVKPLPGFYLDRPAPFKAAHDALCADSIAPAVISAPPRATALFGYGGIGKSTLAAALAHDCQVRRTFHDGIIWLEVGQTPTPAALLASVGAAVFGDNRDNYQNERDAKLALAKVLQNKTALIVLDDVWDHRVVGFFPIEGTACRLLITTRSGALAQKVEGADIRLDLLTPDEGAALIAGITASHDARYREISALLGGHTLAIELAARQLKNGYADDAADLLRLLTKRDNPFAHLKLSEDDKNENLELSLSLSYKALSDDLKRRFRALGVLALEGSFDRAALAALWGDDDPDEARAPLRALLDAGLVEAALTPRPPLPTAPSGLGEGEEESAKAVPEKPRYSQHRLLRAYARALLEEHGELDAAFGRYADDVIEQAQQFRQLPLEAWGQLEPLLPHVLEVGDGLADHWAETMPERLAALAWAMRDYFFFRGDQLRAGKASGQPSRIRWFEAALTVYRQDENPRRLSGMLYSLSSLYEREGLWAQALQALEESLGIDTTLNDPRAIAVTQSSIADLYVQQGRWDEALALYEASLKTKKQLNDPRAIAVTQINLAQHFIGRGESLSRAMGLLWNGYLIIERLKNPREIKTVREIFAGWKRRMGAADFDALWAAVVAVSQPDWLAGVGGQPTEEEQAAEAMRMLAGVYRQGGADALRQMLAGQVPDEVIEQLITQLASDSPRPEGEGPGVRASAPSTLPAETVNVLASNTVAVCTTHTDKRDEWRAQLAQIRADFAGRGDDWAIEVAFADALLALAAGQSASLPDDNPYAGVVQQVWAAIEGYRPGGES